MLDLLQINDWAITDIWTNQILESLYYLFLLWWPSPLSMYFLEAREAQAKQEMKGARKQSIITSEKISS
ncbi:hypothetical protein D3C85_1448230 [compost metagenome]